MFVCIQCHGQTEILLILIAGETFIYQSNYDNTLSVILSIILIGATVILLLIFIVQVGALRLRGSIAGRRRPDRSRRC